MGYPIHVKKTSKGLLYRVWSSITDTYISEEMTETELREFELVRQTKRSVQRICQDMDRDIAQSTPVKEWKRDRQKFEPMTDEQYERALDYEASQLGARVDVNIENNDDGSKILTIKIKPVPKRS